MTFISSRIEKTFFSIAEEGYSADLKASPPFPNSQLSAGATTRAMLSMEVSLCLTDHIYYHTPFKVSLVMLPYITSVTTRQ